MERHGELVRIVHRRPLNLSRGPWSRYGASSFKGVRSCIRDGVEVMVKACQGSARAHTALQVPIPWLCPDGTGAEPGYRRQDAKVSCGTQRAPERSLSYRSDRCQLRP